MERLQPRHLILVRHGESEGDVRRRMGAKAIKHPRDEKQTETGHEQSRIAGRWIAKYIMQAYGIKEFDKYLTSPLIRTSQSAESLRLSNKWLEEPRLTERDRGDIQGITKRDHKEKYPDSYQKMLDHPFHWAPPGGESILAVSHRFGELIDDLENVRNVIMMTHRDVLWSAHVPLDKLSLDNVERLDTDSIYNGQVIHYTNVDPTNGSIGSDSFCWKRSVCPWVNDKTVMKASRHWINISPDYY